MTEGSGFDWHSALTAGICLSFKLLCDERVFASDATSFTSKYTPEHLVALEVRAFAVWLPKIAQVHALAFHFRTALLDLALDHNSARAPTQKEVTVLIVEQDAALRAQHVDVVRAVGPNATILCAACYVAARDQTLARLDAGSPVHLVLAGACINEKFPYSADVQVRTVKQFMRAVDPRKGAARSDMRERPLMAAVCPEGMSRQLFRVGVDAVLPGGKVTAAALLTLLDFICDWRAEERNSTKPPIEEPSAVCPAQAAQASPNIGLKGIPVPTPLAARLTIAGLTPPLSRQTSEQPHRALIGDGWAVPSLPQLAHAAPATHTTLDTIGVKGGTPVPTPMAARFCIAEEGLQSPSRTSGQPHRASVCDGNAISSPPQLAHAETAAHATLAPLKPLLTWQASSRAVCPPDLDSICESGNDAHAAPSAHATLTALPPFLTTQSLDSISESGNDL